MLPLNGNRYILKRQLLRVLGRGFGIYDENNHLVLQADEAYFRIREEIRLRGGYGTGDLMGIFAQSILRFAATYDIVDLTDNALIGGLRRQWLQSAVRDEWTLLDPWGREVGMVIEDSMGRALFRRFLVSFVPQNYDLLVGGRKVADLRQNFNPLSYHLTIDFLVPPTQFDRRLGIAAAVLLGAVEGRQKSDLHNLTDAIDLADTINPF